MSRKRCGSVYTTLKKCSTKSRPFMATAKQNGYVTWTNLLVIIGLALTAAIGISSMHRGEQIQFEKRVMERFGEMKDRLNRIEEKLK